MKKDLDYIFNSEFRLKALRLFLFNGESNFDLITFANRINANIKDAKKEINSLLGAGLIVPRIFYKNTVKGGEEIKLKVKGFGLNQNFQYLKQLSNFLTGIAALTPDEIIKMTKKAGRIKLIILAGVFIQAPESRLDIMIVGDKLNIRQLEKIIKKIESEMGKELAYSIFESEDFKYRLSMCDKLIRDVMENTHNTIIDTMGIDRQV